MMGCADRALAVLHRIKNFTGLVCRKENFSNFVFRKRNDKFKLLVLYYEIIDFIAIYQVISCLNCSAFPLCSR